MTVSTINRWNVQAMPSGDRQCLVIDIQVVVQASEGADPQDLYDEAAERVTAAFQQNLNVRKETPWGPSERHG